MTGGMPRWAFVPGEALRPILPRSVSDRESLCRVDATAALGDTSNWFVGQRRLGMMVRGRDLPRLSPTAAEKLLVQVPHRSAFDGGSARVARAEHSCQGAMAAWMPEVPEMLRHGSTAGLPCLALREQL